MTALIAIKGNVEQATELSDYIESFIIYRQIGDNTANTYRSQLGKFLDNCKNPLSSAYIHHWIESLKDNYAPLTIKSMVETVKGFLQYLNDHDLAHNKAYLQVIYKYEYTGGNHKRVPKNKFMEMLDNCDITTYNGIRDYALLRLLQSTGMRIHEPLKCTIGDIVVYESYDVDERGEYIPLKIPLLSYIQKGNRQAFVSLFPKTYDAIKSYLAMRSDGSNKNAPLFLSHSSNTKGNRVLTQNSAEVMLRKRFNNVGLVGREYSAHSFRYTQAMDVLEQTGDESLASRQLRHLSPKTIQYYVQEIRAKQNAKSMLDLEY
jgi:site-specific recombinase XerD